MYKVDEPCSNFAKGQSYCVDAFAADISAYSSSLALAATKTRTETPTETLTETPTETPTETRTEIPIKTFTETRTAAPSTTTQPSNGKRHETRHLLGIVCIQAYMLMAVWQ